MIKRVAILISGGGSNMVALAKSMTGDHPARAVLVLANSADAGGLQKAADLGIETAVVDHRTFGGDRAAFETQLSKVLLTASPDVICLAGFMRVLSADFVMQWQGRILNIHPSLLPKYKGLNTHARALEAGDAEAGCSVHQVVAELDGGPILGQARVPVLSDDTSDALAARILPLEHQLYPAVLRKFVTGDKNMVNFP